MKKLLLLLVAGWSMAFYGQIPAYYSSIDFNVSGEALKDQIALLITQTHHTFLSYTPGTWEAIKISDIDPENPNNVFLIYGYNDSDGVFMSDRTRFKDDNCTFSGCIGLWNREHVYPRSLGNPNLGFDGVGADVHNLRAIDAQMNSHRGNRRFIQGSGNGGNIGNFFYPGDEWKGDVARMMMYMYLRYGEQCEAVNVGAGSTAMSPLGDMPDIFLLWNEQDPVSPYEMVRNDLLETLQGNRNPFIDNPYLVTMIWNGPAAADPWNSLSITNTTVPNWAVYPTVTRDVVYVQTSTEQPSYEIYSINGQKLEGGTTKETLSFSNYPSGLYLIRLHDGKSEKVVKVMKQ
ncbi:MAG: endonuclease [Flavobacterium sp.]